MLIDHLVADAFGTKCYVVALAKGSECVVVDPGIGVFPRLRAYLTANRLHPVAAMMTHGHLDHTFSVTPLSGARHIPAYIHPGDRHMLTDPFAGLGPLFSPQFRAAIGPDWDWTEPDDVRPLEDGSTMELAGIPFHVDHVPGHTSGSVMFTLPGDAQADAYCLIGDTVYAGTIGRTDMPGGSREQLLRSLRAKVLTMTDGTALLTAHGRATTVGEERFANPFLIQAAGEEVSASAH
jgi:glyoxylase-like metal-dependent hydrolase (beta-lactamase superfamily II)